MTEELDALFFDAGGVLWDLKPSVGDLFEAEISARGHDVSRSDLDAALLEADRLMDERFAAIGGDETAFWEEYDRIVLDRLGVGIDRGGFATALRERIKAAADRVENWVPFPDAVPTLQAVRRRDFKVGLISNATELARRVLKNLDMERYFDIVVISDEVGVRKPDPRIFRLALGHARAAPSRALYIGDKPATDVRGAMGAGMTAVLIDRHCTFPDSQFITIRSLDEIRRLM